MNKQPIQLTQNDLRNIVSESVKRVLKEGQVQGNFNTL